MNGYYWPKAQRPYSTELKWWLWLLPVLVCPPLHKSPEPPQNWILTIPRANNFYVEVGSKTEIPPPSWNSWSGVFLSYHWFCCCCVLTKSTLSEQLRHRFHLLLHGEQLNTVLVTSNSCFYAELPNRHSGECHSVECGISSSNRRSLAGYAWISVQ